MDRKDASMALILLNIHPNFAFWCVLHLNFNFNDYEFICVWQPDMTGELSDTAWLISRIL